jgi:hypothetical protein
MNTTILVEVRQVYGCTKVYPMNDQAKRLAGIAGTATLTPYTLQQAEAMGFTVTQVEQKPLKEILNG